MRLAGWLGNPFRVERIASAADGADDVRIAQRQAQAADVDIDRAELDILAVRPDGLEQLLARKDAAWIFEEVTQQAIFGGPELDGLAVSVLSVRARQRTDASSRQRNR